MSQSNIQIEEDSVPDPPVQVAPGVQQQGPATVPLVIPPGPPPPGPGQQPVLPVPSQVAQVQNQTQFAPTPAPYEPQQGVHRPSPPAAPAPSFPRPYPPGTQATTPPEHPNKASLPSQPAAQNVPNYDLARATARLAPPPAVSNQQYTLPSPIPGPPRPATMVAAPPGPVQHQDQSSSWQRRQARVARDRERRSRAEGRLNHWEDTHSSAYTRFPPMSSAASGAPVTSRGTDASQAQQAQQVEDPEKELKELLWSLAHTPVLSLRPRLRSESQDIPVWQGAVTLDLDMPLVQAFTTLAQANILGAPVVTAGVDPNNPTQVSPEYTRIA